MFYEMIFFCIIICMLKFQFFSLFTSRIVVLLTFFFFNSRIVLLLTFSLLLLQFSALISALALGGQDRMQTFELQLEMARLSKEADAIMVYIYVYMRESFALRASRANASRLFSTEAPWRTLPLFAPGCKRNAHVKQ